MEYLYAVMEIFTEYFILLNICMNMEYLKPRFGVPFFPCHRPQKTNNISRRFTQQAMMP